MHQLLDIVTLLFVENSCSLKINHDAVGLNDPLLYCFSFFALATLSGVDLHGEYKVSHFVESVLDV